MKPLLLVAAVALLDGERRVLLAQRPQGKSMAGLWEFPGGKVEAGEAPEQALVRECREELDITLDALALRPLTFASHAYAEFHLMMPVFLCRRWTGEIRAREGQNIEWVRPDAVHRYDLPPADVGLAEQLPALLSLHDR